MHQITSRSRVLPDDSSMLTNGQLALVTVARLALTTAYRILYPLLPFLALRLHVNLQTVSALVTVQVLASMISPLGGALADTRGERATMSLGLSLFCVGTAICSMAASFGGFLAGYAVIGLAIALYQPGAQAYLSARTPYERRGWALGIFELSWAGGALLGVAPLMQLVESTGDIAPVFGVLLMVGLGSLAAIRYALPASQRSHAGPQGIAWNVLQMPVVLGLLGMLLCALCAVDLLFVVQGAWLKTNFGASEAQLGQVFGMMGVAELLGVSLSTLLVDRLGKKRTVIGGYLLTALAAAALPISDGNWLLFLPLLFLFDLAFEFAIVSTFPLASGIVPTLRGTVMALAVTAIGIGRALGSTVSGPIWATLGIGANGLLASVLILIGVAICARFVHETEQPDASL